MGASALDSGHQRRRVDWRLRIPTFAVLTSSDTASAGDIADLSGDAIIELLAPTGFELAERVIVPDDRDLIAARLQRWADSGEIDLICTTGGTGLGPRDVTPEATAEVIDFEVPGMAEAIRAQTFAITPFSMVSRGKVGVRGRTLIVNLPGSPKGARECLQVVLPVLPHAVEVLHGRGRAHPEHGRGSG